MYVRSGEPLRLLLAECSLKDNLQSGLETGWIVFGLVASVYFVSLLKKVLKCWIFIIYRHSLRSSYSSGLYFLRI